MDAKVVCQEYSSSLEDLTFNSKPLINVLTMLAEENSQHATEIVKLIEKRIYEVTVDKKLPSLYLMDSIVKNIGKEYITAVTQCIVALFTHVFEKGDEKVRMSLYKLRNTWPQYFGAKKLHEIDCSIHKLDPGWPVMDPPPASPSIHINPKFLPKVEESAEEPKGSSSHEAKILEDFQRKKEELEKLQGEQMRLQLLQLEELQLKHELIKKKQEQERQELIKQQQEKILQMRLQQENIGSSEVQRVDTQTLGITTNTTKSFKDPRLEKIERSIAGEAKTGVREENGNAKRENTEGKITPSNKPVDINVKKVGFDTEFVPLDKSYEDLEPPDKTTYNRDRPLGKERYFTKDVTDQVRTKDGNKGQPVVIARATERKTTMLYENSRENREGERLTAGTVNHREKGKKLSTIPFQKEHTEDSRRNSRREFDEGAKRKLSGRGRERDVRKSGNRRREKEIGKHMRPRNRTQESNEELPDAAQDKFPRRDDWNRGRGHKKPRRGHPRDRGVLAERQPKNRPPFPPPSDNIDRLRERPGRNWAPDNSKQFERGFNEEPPVKKLRPSPPRPLFSEREISEIRERRVGSPPRGFPPGPPRDYDLRQNLPDWRSQEPGFEPDFHARWHHEEPRAGVNPEFFEQPFTGAVPPDLREPRFRHPDDMHLPPHEGFPTHHFPPDFHRHPHHFAGGVEIPMELTLDNESEILRSAQRRLSTGDLSEEQHHELLEKLQQLYELQKWQRRHSLDMSSHHEEELHFPPRHPLHPPAGLTQHTSLPGPEPPVVGGQGFPDQPGENIVFGEPLPGVFDLPQAPAVEMTDEERRAPPLADPTFIGNPDVRSDFEQPAVKGEVVSGPPSNLIMEKQTVDDLFKRLVNFGIITKINNEASNSPGRAMTPPVEPEPKEIPVPEIELTLDSLRRRYDGVIMGLHRGTQCSSCGLRFREADNAHYRQHLDWHFRMNRKEKEITAAHRSWFITVDDWLDFESSEDPKLKARSSVFEADSDDESKNSEEGPEGSCPVLKEDTESETVCDICLEKFEQFWDETSEDWHYRGAVRIDGKTYHHVCYQDAGEVESVDDETEETDGEDNRNEDEGDSANMTSYEDEEKSSKGEIKETSSNNDKTSILTDEESVEGGKLGVNNANKEDKKPECS